MLFDSQGKTWALSQRGLYRYQDTLWHKFSNSSIFGITPHDFKFIKEGANNDKWLVPGTNQIIKFNGSSFSQPTFPISGWMSNFAYVNGTYWFGNNFRIFKQEGSDLIEYNYTNSGLPIGDFVKDIESDANGNLWVATSFGLTKMMDDTIWTTYHFSFPTVTIFHQIIYDQNNIMWIKAGSGIIKYDGNDWLYYNKENSNIMGGVTAMMFSPQNELWVGTATGLSKFEAYSHDTLTVTQTIGVYNSVDKIKGFNYAVYPNPFQDEFIIDGANIQDNIVVYDILGKKQGFEIVSNHPFTVRLNDNKKGIFLVKIESNSQVCTFKILKE